MNEQMRKNNSSTKEENQSKEMGTKKCTTVNNKSGFPMSQMPTNGISTCWMLEMARRNVTVRILIWWVVDVNTEN